MIFTPSGQRIKPQMGFTGDWCRIREERPTAAAVAWQHTYQDWEPLEYMAEPNKETE